MPAISRVPRRTIAALAKSPKAAERAAVLRTKVLGRQGKHGEAHRRAGPPDRLAHPRIRQRQCAAHAGQGGEPGRHEEVQGGRGARPARSILASPPEDAAAQAPAYNTLGDCLSAPANHPKEALIAYLHTDLLYSKDKAEHPVALLALRSRSLFRQIKQDAKADEFALRLKQEYPRSSWNRVAAETQ